MEKLICLECKEELGTSIMCCNCTRYKIGQTNKSIIKIFSREVIQDDNKMPKM